MLKVLLTCEAPDPCRGTYRGTLLRFGAGMGAPVPLFPYGARLTYGLGVIYPAANEGLYQRVASDGCLLTEFPPGERPNAGSFPRRNRLISGLAKVTIVVEARGRSGALITADCALAQGKEVLAVPGPITSPISLGCNRLIQHGAKPALGLRDVLEEYGQTFEAAPAAALPTDLTHEERQILDILGLGIDQIDDVAHRFGKHASDALAVLTSLEIRGLVTQDPGKVFRTSAPSASSASSLSPPPGT